jgi:DNA-nicking Smr family endonuclease
VPANRGRSSGVDEPLLDLHGLRVEEALRRTTAFLVQEQGRGTVSVRVVTGHGTGALKEAVGDLLRRHPLVASVQSSLHSGAVLLVVLNPPARGGLGNPRSR